MSKLRMPSSLKPPLAENGGSRIPLPPHRILRSETTSIQSTPVSLKKPQQSNRLSGAEESELRPEYQTISCDLQALAKMVKDEFGNEELVNDETINNMNMDSNVVYERGRLYDEYTARRNERLRRKKGTTVQEKKTTSYNLGVNVEPGKKRDMKKTVGMRKSLPPNFAVTETPRYSLRSNSKENKRPPLAVNVKKSVLDSERKLGTRRTRRI